MEKKHKIVLAGMILLSLSLLYWSFKASINNNKTDVKEVAVQGLVSEIPEHSEEIFTKAVESEEEDPCATPEGYTDDAWRQHMSHHPDQYKDCL